MVHETFNVTIVAKLKHGALYEAMKKRGWTLKQTAAFLGVSPTVVSAMVNLKARPPYVFSKRRECDPVVERKARELTEKLMELTGMTVEDLFPETVMVDEFLQRSKQFTVNRDVTVSALVGYVETLTLPPSPDEELIAKEEGDEFCEVMSVASQILKNYPKVLADFHRVCVDGKTHEEVAQERGVSTSAVSANVNKARHKIQEAIAWRRLRESTTGR